MRGEDTKLVLSIALASLFSLALLYATFEIPLLAGRLLLGVLPDYNYAAWNEARTFVNALRPVSYATFI